MVDHCCKLPNIQSCFQSFSACETWTRKAMTHNDKKMIFVCSNIKVYIIFFKYVFIALFGISLTPEKPDRNYSWVISTNVLSVRFRELKLSEIDISKHEWNTSTLVRAMAWCCQAPSHYPDQCWPSSSEAHKAMICYVIPTQLFGCCISNTPHAMLDCAICWFAMWHVCKRFRVWVSYYITQDIEYCSNMCVS